MSKIRPSLYQAFQREPGKQFSTLIVINSDCDPATLHLVQPRRLMDSVITAKISERDIRRLADLEEVISIELDSEVGVS